MNQLLLTITPILAQSEDLTDYRLSSIGLTFMVTSIVCVVLMVSFCYYRVLTQPGANNNQPQTTPGEM